MSAAPRRHHFRDARRGDYDAHGAVSAAAHPLSNGRLESAVPRRARSRACWSESWSSSVGSGQ
ncbi:hypothetical protein CURTO8I2_70171 [Curtobacterium sp. 8I-2]|nr:hypothetical protein CURTO8I2_70171 [Curtobacterium sp. 8I-2]